MRRVARLIATTDVKPSVGPVAKAAERLDDIIERITADMVAQDASFRAYRALATAARAQLAVVRHEFMLPVARLGQAHLDSVRLRADRGAREAKRRHGLVGCAVGMGSQVGLARPQRRAARRYRDGNG